MFTVMQTIGQRLKTAREEKKLTLDKVFEDTRIRVSYLRALELDDLSSMPSPVQARGYLRNYAEYLGLDIDQILEDVRSSPEPADEIIGPADSTSPLDAQSIEPLSDEPTPPPAPPAIDTEHEAESQPEAAVDEPDGGQQEESLQPDVTD
ncbi:MAG TPA: helix-turn-helix domain-containing protein, partial [Anaerolineales bacterium]|nr:helix-turn-helix domain-containing protein [Anaerolineales bacterium]